MVVATIPWPTPFSRDAPRFVADYVDFDIFFDAIDELGCRARAPDSDRMKWACRYAGAESESWKFVESFSEPNATFATFRDQVHECYPQLDKARRFSFRDLDDLTQRTQTCPNMTQKDLGRYYRSFLPIAAHLRDYQGLSEREHSRRYLEGFPQPIRDNIARRLELTKPDVIPTDGYNFNDIQVAATFVFAAGGADYRAPVVTPTSSTVSASGLTAVEDLVRAMLTMVQSFASVVQNQPPPSYPQPLVRPPSQVCAFCSAPDHCIRECPIVGEYHQQGKIARNDSGKIVLPDGRLPPRIGSSRNLQERVDYAWQSQNVRGNDDPSCEQVSTHFLEVQSERSFTSSTSTLGNHRHDTASPTTTPEVQEEILSLQAQIESLRKSAAQKRATSSLQHQATLPPAPAPRLKSLQPTIYSRPPRSSGSVTTPLPRHSMQPILAPPRPSNEYKYEFAANSAPQAPVTAEEAVDTPSEFPEPHRQHTQPRSGSEEPATAESIVESLPTSPRSSFDAPNTPTTPFTLSLSSSGPLFSSDSSAGPLLPFSEFIPTPSLAFSCSPTTTSSAPFVSISPLVSDPYQTVSTPPDSRTSIGPSSSLSSLFFSVSLASLSSSQSPNSSSSDPKTISSSSCSLPSTSVPVFTKPSVISSRSPSLPSQTLFDAPGWAFSHFSYSSPHVRSSPSLPSRHLDYPRSHQPRRLSLDANPSSAAPSPPPQLPSPTQSLDWLSKIPRSFVQSSNSWLSATCSSSSSAFSLSPSSQRSQSPSFVRSPDQASPTATPLPSPASPLLLVMLSPSSYSFFSSPTPSGPLSSRSSSLSPITIGCDSPPHSDRGPPLGLNHDTAARFYGVQDEFDDAESDFTPVSTPLTSELVSLIPVRCTPPPLLRSFLARTAFPATVSAQVTAYGKSSLDQAIPRHVKTSPPQPTAIACGKITVVSDTPASGSSISTTFADTLDEFDNSDSSSRLVSQLRTPPSSPTSAAIAVMHDKVYRGPSLDQAIQRYKSTNPPHPTTIASQSDSTTTSRDSGTILLSPTPTHILEDASSHLECWHISSVSSQFPVTVRRGPGALLLTNILLLGLGTALLVFAIVLLASPVIVVVTSLGFLVVPWIIGVAPRVFSITSRLLDSVSQVSGTIAATPSATRFKAWSIVTASWRTYTIVRGFVRTSLGTHLKETHIEQESAVPRLPPSRSRHRVANAPVYTHQRPRAWLEVTLAVRRSATPHHAVHSSDRTNPRLECVTTAFDRSLRRLDDIRWLPGHHCMAVEGFWNCVRDFCRLSCVFGAPGLPILAATRDG